jgi:hypothetical protein
MQLYHLGRQRGRLQHTPMQCHPRPPLPHHLTHPLHTTVTTHWFSENTASRFVGVRNRPPLCRRLQRRHGRHAPASHCVLPVLYITEYAGGAGAPGVLLHALGKRPSTHTYPGMGLLGLWDEGCGSQRTPGTTGHQQLHVEPQYALELFGPRSSRQQGMFTWPFVGGRGQEVPSMPSPGAHTTPTVANCPSPLAWGKDNNHPNISARRRPTPTPLGAIVRAVESNTGKNCACFWKLARGCSHANKAPVGSFATPSPRSHRKIPVLGNPKTGIDGEY